MINIPENKDIVFVDIEANDKPKRLLQFGAIKLKTNGEIDKKNWFCNPKCKISPHVYKMVSKNIKKIEKGMIYIRIIEKIYRYLNNTVLVSYGGFDFHFLNEMSKKFLSKPLNVQYIDLQNEWKKISMTKEVWSLNRLSNFFKINVNENELHDAQYDAWLLYCIFVEWQKKNKEEIIKEIYKTNTKGLRRININQNKTNKSASTINNIQEQGFCFLKIGFQPVNFYETKKQILYKLDVLETNKTEIKRNWSFYYKIEEKFFNHDDYTKELISALKKYIISSRNKRIIISEKDFHKLVKLNNLCAEYLNVFPLNTIMFTNGYKYLYSKINIDNEIYMNNIELIKKWKVFLYIHNELE